MLFISVSGAAWSGRVHGAEVNGRVEGADREAGAPGGGPASRGTPSPPAAPLHATRPQGEPASAHEHSPRQVSLGCARVFKQTNMQLRCLHFLLRAINVAEIDACLCERIGVESQVAPFYRIGGII